MVVSLFIPTSSPNGVIIGMVKAACPVPEPTKKLITDCTTNIAYPDNRLGRGSITLARLYSIVSIILASLHSITMALAIPTTMAAPTISFAPLMKFSTISLTCIFPKKPDMIPKAKNTAAISFMYHSYFKTPTIIRASPANNVNKISLCLNVNSTSTSLLPIRFNSSFLFKSCS